MSYEEITKNDKQNILSVVIRFLLWPNIYRSRNGQTCQNKIAFIHNINMISDYTKKRSYFRKGRTLHKSNF